MRDAKRPRLFKALWMRKGHLSRKPELWGRADLLKSLCKWAGHPANFHSDVREAAKGINRQLQDPIDAKDLELLCAWVEIRRWDEWTIDQSEEGFREWQAKQGRRSGDSRRWRTRKRDAAIVGDRRRGDTLKAIAHRYGLTTGGVRYVVKRETEHGGCPPSWCW